jgi:amidase
MDSELTAMSAGTLARMVRSGELAAEQVVRAHLARIEERERDIGAFERLRAEAALEEARRVGERADLGELALAGVPVAVKDNVDVAGEPTRCGSGATPSRLAAQDDPLVRRLRAAGAVVIGKTRLPELAIWPFTESQASGDTRNPWNVARTPGGSTGGGAAAVAARMAPLALGSDGGGSIRIPAACCGIAGLKPGPGVVPLAGGAAEHWLGLSEFGPLARSVADLALMFDVLRGAPDAGRARASAARLRLAVSTKSPAPGAPVDAQVKQAVTSVAGLLAGAGHALRKADPPYPLDLGLRYSRRWLAGIARDAQGLPPERLEPRTRAMAKAGRWIARRGWDKPAADDAFGARVLAWFEAFDVLLMPTLTRPAERLGKWRGKGWLATTLGVANWVCTPPWNLARFPAASIPAGMSADGLPIGMQLVAPPGGEDRLLALMAELEALKPWPAAP